MSTEALFFVHLVNGEKLQHLTRHLQGHCDAVLQRLAGNGSRFSPQHEAITIKEQKKRVLCSIPTTEAPFKVNLIMLYGYTPFDPLLLKGIV